MGPLKIIALCFLILVAIIAIFIFVSFVIYCYRIHYGEEKFVKYFENEGKRCKQCKHYEDFYCKDPGKECHYVFYRKITCAGCKHLFYYNDGSVDCDLDKIQKESCLKSQYGVFYEKEKEV